MAQLSTNLIVRGEAVQGLYAQFRAGNLVVNRRYQRKLVWSVDEKQSFINSLMNQLPVPLILVAERPEEEGSRLEIIDGLQRLDAVFSFVENAFPADGYFDLESLAETKEDLDARVLKQRKPKLAREICTRFAGYNLPLSVYRAQSDDEVDEVFRRINSGGRHLSRQDLRQAGSTSNFADLVRDIAATIRGDVSLSDLVDLRDMPKISISSVNDGRGIFVDEISWVKQRILEREQVRESRDEEVIADLLASMLIDPVPAYDSRVLDEFYGFSSGTDSRHAKMEAVIQRESSEGVKERFTKVHSAFSELFQPVEFQFSSLLFEEAKQRVPRYFEAVFLGLDKLLTEENLELADLEGARKAVKGIGSHHINIPSGGGTWTASSKRKNADVVAGILRPHMQSAGLTSNPRLERNALEVERVLRAARVENSLVEFKQGLSRLGKAPKLDPKLVAEVCHTASAMANHGKDATGYILIGVADTEADAKRVEKVGGPSILMIEGKFLTGIGLDVTQQEDLDSFLLWFTEKVKDSDLVDELKAQVLRDFRAVDIQDRTVLLLRVKALSEPVPYGDKFFERLGSQTVEVEVSQVARLFHRFN